MNLFATPLRIKNNRIEHSLNLKLITENKEYLVLDYEKQDNVNVILILQDNGIIDWYPMFGFKYRYADEGGDKFGKEQTETTNEAETEG